MMHHGSLHLEAAGIRQMDHMDGVNMPPEMAGKLFELISAEHRW